MKKLVEEKRNEKKKSSSAFVYYECKRKDGNSGGGDFYLHFAPLITNMRIISAMLIIIVLCNPPLTPLSPVLLCVSYYFYSRKSRGITCASPVRQVKL